MDKKSKEIIKEAIEYFLQLRFNFTYNRIHNSSTEENSENKLEVEETPDIDRPFGKPIKRPYRNDSHKLDAKFRFMKEYKEKGLSVLSYGDDRYNKSFDTQLIRLNSLLDKKDQFQQVVDLEQQMKKIQAKKFITVKEFTEIYNISKTSQQNYRGRMHDPLPYHQKVAGGKIVYVVEEVEKWFENQHK